MPVADTVIVLEALAARRNLAAADLESSLLLPQPFVGGWNTVVMMSGSTPILREPARPLRQLGDQLQRPLGPEPRRDLCRTEGARRPVLAPAALNLLQHRRTQVAGEPRG